TYQTFIKERRNFPHIEIATPEKPDHIKAYENVVYTTLGETPYGSRDLHLNIYRPDDRKTYPALLMIHGGGWNSGDLSMEIPMALKVAEKGYVTVPVEYRLIPEALYPAGLHDIKAAIRWLRENAAAYGIDTSRIAVSGTSAGGQLANLTGATNGSPIHEGGFKNMDNSSCVQAVINIDGLCDFAAETIMNRAQKAKDDGDKMPIDAVWLGGAFEDNPQNWMSASPIYWISQQSAPVCFINSAILRFHEGRDRQIAKMDVLGIYSETHTIDSTPHTFWLFHPWFETTVNYMADFLDKVLKQDKSEYSIADINTLRWKQIVHNMPEKWYGSEQAVFIAENVILYQRNTGGWPKNVEIHHMMSDSYKKKILEEKNNMDDSTIDNDATIFEMIYLAKVYKETNIPACKEAFLKGLDYLYEAQYDNGGWPQFYPLRKGYYSCITYNDDAMVNVMQLLKSVADKDPAYDFVRKDDPSKCTKAFNRGVDCILKTQYKQNSELTVWCAQHDAKTLEPAKARAYELPSLSGSESADIVLLLQSIKNPSPEVKRSIEAAKKWFEKVRIDGIQVETYINDKGLRDRRVVQSPGTPPLWARFYELEDNRPFFCDRDGIKRYSMAEIGYERRNGYGWYTDRPSSLINTGNNSKNNN
ncbi:MAG: pectate lyase, partial [Tannerella sp.]|nr:pectate lyase [Tannerella sp.]